MYCYVLFYVLCCVLSIVVQRQCEVNPDDEQSWTSDCVAPRRRGPGPRGDDHSDPKQRDEMTCHPCHQHVIPVAARRRGPGPRGDELSDTRQRDETTCHPCLRCARHFASTQTHYRCAHGLHAVEMGSQEEREVLGASPPGASPPAAHTVGRRPLCEHVGCSCQHS